MARPRAPVPRARSRPRLAARLAARLAPYAIEAVCGPLVEGAFVAMMVASELGVPFAYSERFPNPERGGLFAVDYRVPRALRAEVRGRRVAIVNDVINAGSAVRGTLTDLEACAARPVAIGALLVLGSSASRIAADRLPARRYSSSGRSIRSKRYCSHSAKTHSGKVGDGRSTAPNSTLDPFRQLDYWPHAEPPGACQAGRRTRCSSTRIG